MKEQTTRKPVLTILAGFLCGLHATLFFLLPLFLYLPYDSSYLLIAFAVITPFAVSSLVLAIVCKRERVKKVWVVFLVIDIIFMVADAGCGTLLSMRSIFGEMGNTVVKNAKDAATIENAKSLIPSKNLTLHTAETDQSEYRYFDDDGKIAEEFLSMDFSLTCESSCFALSETRFELSKNLTVLFSDSFEGVVVHARAESFYGYSDAYRSYSMDPVQGKKLETMINDKIKDQKSAYETREAEVEAETSLTTCLDSMSENDPRFTLTLLNKKYEVGLTRVSDDDKEMLAALYELDVAKLGPWEGNSLTSGDGFHYNPVKSCPYYLYYYAVERCLSVERYYSDPYGSNRKLNVRYGLSVEEGNHLMDVANDIVMKKENAASSTTSLS